jgi:hypothetical protein
MKTFIHFLFLVFCFSLVSAQTEFNVQLLDTKTGYEIHPDWNPDPPVRDRFGDAWGYYYQAENREFAYVGSSRGLEIFEVTDPENIGYITTANEGEATWAIQIYNDYVYAAPGRDDIKIYSLDPPDLPSLVGSIPVGPESDVKRVHDMYVADGVLYLA